jgi:hypothetical protein
MSLPNGQFDNGSGDGEDKDFLEDSDVEAEMKNAGCRRDHDCPGTIGWKNSMGHLFYVPRPCTRKILREQLSRYKTPLAP